MNSIEQLEYKVNQIIKKENKVRAFKDNFYILRIVYVLTSPIILILLNLILDKILFSLIMYSLILILYNIVMKNQFNIKDNILNQEKIAYMKELNHMSIKEDFINLYQQQISILQNNDLSIPINRDMLQKSKEYFDRFILEIDGKDNNDWEYLHTLYKYFYFYKHFTDQVVFKKLDPTKFDIIMHVFI